MNSEVSIEQINKRNQNTTNRIFKNSYLVPFINMIISEILTQYGFDQVAINENLISPIKEQEQDITNKLKNFFNAYIKNHTGLNDTTKTTAEQLFKIMTKFDKLNLNVTYKYKDEPYYEKDGPETRIIDKIILSQPHNNETNEYLEYIIDIETKGVRQSTIDGHIVRSRGDSSDINSIDQYVYRRSDPGENFNKEEHGSNFSSSVNNSGKNSPR